MENDTTSKTVEVDAVGGWVITHWTRTWDTRLPIAQITDEIANQQSTIKDAQATIDELQGYLATAQAAQQSPS